MAKFKGLTVEDVKPSKKEGEEAPPAEEKAPDAEQAPAAEAAPEAAPEAPKAEYVPPKATKYKVKVGRHIAYKGMVVFFPANMELTSHTHDVPYLKAANVDLEELKE
jgi:hypothetical protein